MRADAELCISEHANVIANCGDTNAAGRELFFSFFPTQEQVTQNEGGGGPPPASDKRSGE